MSTDQITDQMRGISIAAQMAVIAYGDRVMRGSRGARIHAVSATRRALHRRGLVTHAGPMPVLTRDGWRAYHALCDIESPEYSMSADPDECMVV